MFGDDAVADRHQDIDDPLAWQSRIQLASLNHLTDHGSGCGQHQADILQTRFRRHKAWYGTLPDQMVQVSMLASQCQADLEPLSNALPIGPGRLPDLFLGLAKEPMAQQKERIVERHLIREVLGECLATDPKPTRHLVEVEGGHPLLLYDGPRCCQDRINGLLPVAQSAFLEGGEPNSPPNGFMRHVMPPFG